MNILEEANQVTGGDRNKAYGHPRDNFKLTADLLTVVLKDVLKEGAIITPELFALCMIQVKIAREMNKPKRDNLVDIAGYARTMEMLTEKPNEKP
jgi:hypothetical protein